MSKSIIEIKDRDSCSIITITKLDGSQFRITVFDREDHIEVQGVDSSLIIEPSVSNEIKISIKSKCTKGNHGYLQGLLEAGEDRKQFYLEGIQNMRDKGYSEEKIKEVAITLKAFATVWLFILSLI